MIRRKLLIATAIIASIVITACSEMTGPKNDPGILPAAVIRAPHRGPATVVATINGGGTAEMQPPIAAGRDSFARGGKLPTAGPAPGHIACVEPPRRATGLSGDILGRGSSRGKVGAH